MKLIYQKIYELYEKEVHASGLAIFRIFYGLVLFCEIAQLFYFRHLIFDYIPYLQPYEIDFTPALMIWMVVVLFLVFGAFTRQVTIINYIFSLVFIGTITTFEYHMFYVYMGVNFVLIFTKVSQVYSIDRLRERLKYLGNRTEYEPSKKVSVLNYYILILVGIGFVYFDSTLYKYDSDVWLSGLGMWLPASLPPFTHSDNSLILNIKWLALGLGYLTLIFETIFILVFFRKRWRIPLFIFGVGLHLGIVAAFPIPWFGLGVAALYCLLVPISWWGRIGDQLSFKKPSLTLYYDMECPLCRRTKIILTHFDWFRLLEFKSVQEYAGHEALLEKVDQDELLSDIYSVTKKNEIKRGVDTYSYAFKRIPLFIPLGLFLSLPGIYSIASEIYEKLAANRNAERCSEENCGFEIQNVRRDNPNKLFNNLTAKDFIVGIISLGITILVILQLNVSYNSSLANKAKDYLKINESFIGGQVIQKVSIEVGSISKDFFGITNHGVFVDYHFVGYNHNIAVVYKNNEGKDIWLPITDKKGQTSYYNIGPLWAKWGFRVNSQNIDRTELLDGLERFTAFWAYKKNFKLDDLTFEILVQKIESTNQWEKNYLRKLMSNEWVKAGEVYWDDENFSADIQNIEEM